MAYREERRLERKVGKTRIGAHIDQAKKSRFAQLAPPVEVVDEEEPPEKPAELLYLFETFVKLSRRISGDGGPISYQDMMSFVIMTATPLLPWEIDVISHLDDLRMLTHDALDKMVDDA